MQRLSALGNRRLAVRLRHLFQLVAQTAEIISATYIAHDQSGEILVAPLSTDGNKVGAVFGGIVTRLGAKRRRANLRKALPVCGDERLPLALCFFSASSRVLVWAPQAWRALPGAQAGRPLPEV